MREFKARKERLPTRSGSFAVVFLILGAASAVSTVVGWFNSVDVKGWWPLGIAVYLLFDCVYALLFVAIAQRGRPFGWPLVISYNAALGVALVVASFLFYTKFGTVNWLFANSGNLALSLHLHSVIHSKANQVGLYALFLLVAAILAVVRRP
jgi:hypothetical protein